MWDAPTPSRGTGTETPAGTSQWAETPARGKWDMGEKTIGDVPGGKRSRWDETPASRMFGSGTATPVAGSGMATPVIGQSVWQQEMAWRNRPLSDEELDSILPGGYRIVTPPESYVGAREREGVMGRSRRCSGIIT